MKLMTAVPLSEREQVDSWFNEIKSQSNIPIKKEPLMSRAKGVLKDKSLVIQHL